MARTILIAAGGTGGHLFPGVAVADELERRDPRTRVVFVGTPRGLESRLVPRAGYELELLPILPLNGVGARADARRGSWPCPGRWSAPWRSSARLRPRAVLGVGGYAGGPLVLVAALLGVPTVILEPNAKPGFTNRVLRPFVRHAACSYEEARRDFGAKGVLTGNPVRGGFARLPRKAHAPPLTLLVFGGSQGSRVLNRALVEALPHLPAPDRLRDRPPDRARPCATRSRPPTPRRAARREVRRLPRRHGGALRAGRPRACAAAAPPPARS